MSYRCCEVEVWPVVDTFHHGVVSMTEANILPLDGTVSFQSIYNTLKESIQACNVKILVNELVNLAGNDKVILLSASFFGETLIE